MQPGTSETAWTASVLDLNLLESRNLAKIAGEGTESLVVILLDERAIKVEDRHVFATVTLHSVDLP